MNSPLIAVSVLFVLLTSCAVQPRGEAAKANGWMSLKHSEQEHVEKPQSLPDVETAPLAAQIDARSETAAAVTSTQVTSPARRQPADALAMWNDPAFRRRFLESYQAESDIEPVLKPAEREGMQQILALLAADKTSEAIQLIGQNRGPEASAVIDFTLANIHFQNEELAPAATAYKIAVEKFPKFRRAWKNLGLIHIREGHFDKAVPALVKVIELGGGDAITYGLLGYGYSSLENALAAESAYRMATLLDPATMDWKLGLGRSLLRQQRYADAVALCRTLLGEAPDRVDLWLLQANAYVGLNQPKKAAENFEIVDGLGGSTVESLNTLGDIYVNDEVFELGVDCYVRALEKSPTAPLDRPLRAAKVLVAQGLIDDPKRLLDRIDALRGSELSPQEKKDSLRLRSRLAAAASLGADEASALEEIVKIDPLDGDALLLLGQHHAKNANPEKAVFYYERAASLEAFEGDAKVRHAQLLVTQGRYVEAIPLLKRAQSVKPRDNIQAYLEQVERAAQSR